MVHRFNMVYTKNLCCRYSLELSHCGIKITKVVLNIISVITKTYLYNFDPLKLHFYIVKLGFTGVYIIFLNSAQKLRLWVLVRTASVRWF